MLGGMMLGGMMGKKIDPLELGGFFMSPMGYGLAKHPEYALPMLSPFAGLLRGLLR